MDDDAGRVEHAAAAAAAARRRAPRAGAPRDRPDPRPPGSPPAPGRSPPAPRPPRAGRRPRAQARPPRADRGAPRAETLLRVGLFRRVRARSRRRRRGRRRAPSRARCCGSSVRVRSARSSGETIPSASALRRTHSSSGVQYASPISTTGKCITLPVWISVERLEQLVGRAEAAGEDAEPLGRLHEHRLAGVEVVEDEAEVDVVVHRLLVRQLDPEADREPAAFAAAAVRRLHHARPAARDDGPARLGEEPRRLAGQLVRARPFRRRAPSRSTRPPAGRSARPPRSRRGTRGRSPASAPAGTRASGASGGGRDPASPQSIPLCRVASNPATSAAASAR